MILRYPGIWNIIIHGGAGGKETVKKLREIDPGARVIVSSGYPDNPTVACYKEYGFDGVIDKPYKLDELADAVKNVLCCPDDRQ
ncbi:MAG: hypothetical protein JXB88_23260 [Spirochaetales bacterium]|nr:hypothetical protein [Spirochaetales bacterium]